MSVLKNRKTIKNRKPIVYGKNSICNTLNNEAKS
jgi:hypothetical protein